MKQIMCCWECKEGIKMSYDFFVEDGSSFPFYFCQNKKCPRYGLATIVFKLKKYKK